jgi:cold shock CspA family protein
VRSTVKWFNNQKGIGFILGDDKIKEDILVHHSAILDPKKGFKTLIKDEIVEFDLVKTKFGYRAKNVITIDVSSMQ